MANRTSESQQTGEAIPLRTRNLPQPDTPGISDTRLLPNDAFAEAWTSIIIREGLKERIARSAAAGLIFRERVAVERLPLHGVTMLVGPPGTGKTTLGRGLADRVSRMVTGLGTFAFLEINPHALASSSLGRSQQAVEQLFATTIAETAEGGPLVVLIDEVETIATDRSQLSFEANPADVHRAVDAALVGLDLVARIHRHVMFIMTSNFPQAIDDALTSRADLIVPIGLPDLAARRAILADVFDAVTEAFPGAGHLREGAFLDRAAQESEGLDGRRLRKIIVAAAGRSPESTVDPGQLTADNVMAAIREAIRDGGEM